MIKGLIQQDDTTLVNIYTPNIGAPKYIKQILVNINGETGSNSVIIGDFNIPLMLMNILSRKKIKKETAALNDVRPDRFN